MSSDLKAYLIQKRKAFEATSDQSPLEMKVTLSTPTKSTNEGDDYSPGSEYWAKAITSQPKNAQHSDSKSTSPLKGKILDIKPLKTANSSSSVANLLKRIKGSESAAMEVSEVENTIVSIEEGSSSYPEKLEKFTPERVIDAIEGLERNLQAQRMEILALIQERNLKNENFAPVDQFERLLDKKIGNLESIWKRAVQGPKFSSLTEDFQLEISQRLEALRTEVKETSNSVDRPTKAIISSISEKLIHLAKIQEHEFSSQAQKLSLIEKKISRPQSSFIGEQAEVLQDIRKMVISIDSHIGRAERQQQAENSRLEKLLKLNLGKSSRPLMHGDSSEEDSSDKDDLILSQLVDLKKIITNDQKLTEERMSQFINMFSILQSAHLELLNRLEKLDNNYVKIDAMHSKIDKMNQTLTAYLPLNLESKLLFIERELRSLKK